LVLLDSHFAKILETFASRNALNSAVGFQPPTNYASHGCGDRNGWHLDWIVELPAFISRRAQKVSEYLCSEVRMVAQPQMSHK